MSLHLPNDRDEMDFPLPAVVLQNDLAILLQAVILFFLYFFFQLFGFVILFFRFLVFIPVFLVIFSLSHDRTSLS